MKLLDFTGTFRRVGSVLMLLLLVVAASVAPAGASDSSQSVTQTYGTTGTVQTGMIVRLSSGDSTKVSALSSDDAGAMFGAVVAPNDAALTLSGNTPSQVYVATYGRYGVLVSNQNGPIKAGDLVTISAIDGIGMKADSGQSVVLGRAVGSFSGTGNVVSTASLTTTAGKKVEVSIGRVQVDIGVDHNPLQQSQKAAGVAGYLQSISSGVAGKTVSPARIYLSMAILAVSAVISGVILYGGVRTGISSIGRNPLARKSIMRSLVQVIITSMTIFIIGMFGVYLLLKL